MADAYNRFNLVKNSFFSALTASSTLLLLLLFLFAARHLGVNALGTFSVGMAVGNTVTFALDLGINAIAIRRISSGHNPANEVVSQLLFWRLLIGAIFLSLFVPIIWLSIAEGIERTTILIFGLAGVLRSTNFSFRSLFQAMGRFSSESLIVFVDVLSIVVFGLLVILQGGGPVELAWTFVLVRGSIMFIYLIKTTKIIHSISWRLNWSAMWSLQREAFPLGLAIMISAVFWQIDILLLSALTSAYTTGIFSSAFRIIEGTKVAPSSLANVFYPRLSFCQAQDMVRFDDLLSRGCKYVLIIGAGVTGIALLFPFEIIDLLYGKQYKESATVLSAIAVIPVVFFFAQFLFIGLRALGKQSSILLAQCIGLATKITAGIILIPSHGIVGASIAAVTGTVALTLTATILIVMARKQTLRTLRLIVSIVLSMGIAVAFCSYYTHDWMLMFRLTTVGFVYFASLFLFRVFDSHELDLMLKLKRKLF